MAAKKTKKKSKAKAKSSAKATRTYRNEIRIQDLDDGTYDRICQRATTEKRSPAKEAAIFLEKNYV